MPKRPSCQLELGYRLTHPDQYLDWPPGGQTWSEWLQNVFGPWWPNLATRCKIFTYPKEPSEPVTFLPKLAKKICKQPVTRDNLCKQLFCPWWPNLVLKISGKMVIECKIEFWTLFDLITFSIKSSVFELQPQIQKKNVN